MIYICKAFVRELIYLSRILPVKTVIRTISCIASWLNNHLFKLLYAHYKYHLQFIVKMTW